MSGCGYCRSERPFLAYDETADCAGSKRAYIRAGTNTFYDTSNHKIKFMYCPMCGRPLLDTRCEESKPLLLPFLRRAAVA